MENRKGSRATRLASLITAAFAIAVFTGCAAQPVSDALSVATYQIDSVNQIAANSRIHDPIVGEWQTQVNIFSWTTTILPASAVHSAEYDVVGVITEPLIHFTPGEVILVLRRGHTAGEYTGFAKWRNALGYTWYPARVHLSENSFTQENIIPIGTPTLIDKVWSVKRLTTETARTDQWIYGGIEYLTRDAALKAQQIQFESIINSLNTHKPVGSICRVWVPSKASFERQVNEPWVDTPGEREYCAEATYRSFAAIGRIIERSQAFDRVVIETPIDPRTAPLGDGVTAVWLDLTSRQWYVRPLGSNESRQIHVDYTVADEAQKWNAFIDSIVAHVIDRYGSQPAPTSSGRDRQPADSAGHAKSSESIVPKIFSGSGFAISTRGYIVTNSHVVRDANWIKVRTKERGLIGAQLICEDPQLDLAVLKVETSLENIVALRPRPLAAPGVHIVVIGFPLDGTLAMEGVLTQGTVNALVGVANDSTRLQIDAALQPGNSGGPVFDSTGAVVGVAVARLDESFALTEFGSLPQNVNFAIKHTSLQDFLIAHSIDFETSAGETDKSADRIWTEFHTAVIPIFCERNVRRTSK